MIDADSRRLTTQPHHTLFDLDPWVGQRAATFRFDVVDGPTGMRVGEVHPILDVTPTLSHDVSRTIKRQLSPFALGRSETNDIDPIRHRILPVMVLSNDEEWPLGRYMFSDYTKVKFTGGDLSTSTLVDEMFIIDHQLETAFTSKQVVFGDILHYAETISQEVERLIEGLPVKMRAEATPYSSVSSWPQGTTRGQIIDSLALEGDYLPPWFDNSGVLRFVRSFDPAKKAPDLNWDNSNAIMRDGIAEVNDLLDAWNRLIVVANGFDTTVNISQKYNPLVGIYDVPASAPHSFANRGFRIAEVRTMQITSSAQAQAIANNIGQRETNFERVELSTAPDPRHDSHNVIRWNGHNWLELSWSMQLVEGGEMRHVLRKSYAA